jgi:hypothetical protein
VTPQEIVDGLVDEISTNPSSMDGRRAMLAASGQIEALIAERLAPLRAENERLRLACERMREGSDTSQGVS